MLLVSFHKERFIARKHLVLNLIIVDSQDYKDVKGVMGFTPTVKILAFYG